MREKISKRIGLMSILMTIEIVLYHSGSPSSADAINSIDLKMNELLKYTIEILVPFAMSYFFATTGYLLFSGLSLANYIDKIKRRFKTLLVPYVLWQLIIFCKLVLQKRGWTIGDFITKTFLLQMWPPDGPLWYVYVVFLFSLFSPILLILFKNKRISWICIIMMIVGKYALISYGGETVKAIISYGYINNILYYVPSYLIGCFYGYFLQKDAEADELRYIMYLLLVAIILNGTFGGIFYDMSVIVLPIMSMFLLPTDFLPRLTWISKLLFLVYAIHEPIAVDFNKYFRPLFSGLFYFVFLENIICRLIILAIVVLFAFGIHKTLERISPKLLSLLTGGRK